MNALASFAWPLLNAAGPWLVLVALFGIPCALAYWLGNGFKDMDWAPQSDLDWEFRYNPATGRHEHVLCINGQPMF